MTPINTYISESIYNNLGIDKDTIERDLIEKQLKNWNFNNGGYGYEIIPPKRPDSPYIIKCHNWDIYFTINDDSSFQVPVKFEGTSNTMSVTFNVDGEHKNFLNNFYIKNASIVIKYTNTKDVVIDDNMFNGTANFTRPLYNSLSIQSDTKCNIDLSRLSYGFLGNVGVYLKNGGEIRFNTKQRVGYLAITGAPDKVHNLPQVDELTIGIRNVNVNDIFNIFSDYKQINPKLSLRLGSKSLLGTDMNLKEKLLNFLKTGVKK